jgi:sodium/bile acid cotransporter 7
MSRVRIDPFLVWLTLAVVLASLLPARGSAGDLFWLLSKAAIVLLFFLHGAKLSREAILQGLGNWRLHFATLGTTFALFPILGLATAWLASAWIDPLLVSGLLFLTLLSSTVQSSIALVSVARGNVAAAVCSASLSNLLGIVLTPLLVGLLMTTGKAHQGFDWQAVKSITVQLLLPFVAGHLLRPWIGAFVERNKKVLMPVDRGAIILVVYSAFSAAVVGGIWSRVDAPDLAVLLAVSAVILALVMLADLALARAMGMPREDFIVLLFCGSQKSLVTGVPMAGALFAPAQVGMVVLPLMIFHQLQLFVCAWIAARLASEAD